MRGTGSLRTIRVSVNTLNATGTNMHQILMLTENDGIERVNVKFCDLYVCAKIVKITHFI